jgi:DNA-binding IclR family transcriptional regulator
MAKPAQHRNHAAYFVPGLQRGLALLEVVAAAGEPLAAAEIAQRLGLTRSAVFRLLYTLRHTGFLEAVGDKRVRLGPRVLNLGFAFLASQDIIETARGELESLRDRTGVTTHLAIRDGREVLYLACVQTRSGFLSNMNVGSRVPAHASPMGWLLLGDLSPREVTKLFAGTLPRMTAQTPGDAKALLGRIAEATTTGHVVSRGIMEAGGSSIAAPVHGRDGQVVAAIDISGPDSGFEVAALERRYLPEVLAAAARISARLGWEATPAAPPKASHAASRPAARSPRR